MRFPSLKSYIQEQKKAAALARKGNAKVFFFLWCLHAQAHPVQAKLAEFADGKLKGEKLAKAKERCAGVCVLDDLS